MKNQINYDEWKQATPPHYEAPTNTARMKVTYTVWPDDDCNEITNIIRNTLRRVSIVITPYDDDLLNITAIGLFDFDAFDDEDDTAIMIYECETEKPMKSGNTLKADSITVL